MVCLPHVMLAVALLMGYADKIAEWQPKAITTQRPRASRGRSCYNYSCRQPSSGFGRTSRWYSTEVVGSTSDYISLEDSSTTTLPPEIVELQKALAAVRTLPRLRKSSSIPFEKSAKIKEDEEDPLLALAIAQPEVPTFRRLFNYETWDRHLGGKCHARWFRCLKHTWHSEIIRSIYPSVIGISLYAMVAGFVLRSMSYFQKASSAQQQMPLSLAANAISLLLVFRTNNAYRRLEEARELWSDVIYWSREMMSYCVSVWSPSDSIEPNGSRPSEGKDKMDTASVVTVARYLTAFLWSLRDTLRDGDQRCDILNLLLNQTKSSKESEWISRPTRSRPMAIHGRLRRFLQQQFRQGKLREQSVLFLEGQLAELSAVVTKCDRLFTSPIPPSMSSHGMRSTTLFFATVPIVLASSLRDHHPVLITLWTAIIAFVYLGIEELGVQVEQPFQMIPLWQLCHAAQGDMEEIVVRTYQDISDEQSNP